LGVERVVNACGPVTALGGAVLDRRVAGAMADASRTNVRMEELLAAAGRRIAGLLGAEAAMVTSGSACGLVLAAAACMTGQDRRKAHRLPNTQGMKNEVLMFAAQDIVYARNIPHSGAKLIQIPQRRSLRRAIGAKTAAFVYFPGVNEDRCPSLSDCARICHRRGVAAIIDAAAKPPLRANVRRFMRDGADLLLYSGGKAIGGPQPSGILCGRPDLVAAAVLNGCPHEGIGRPMKVGREEVAGLVRALELFLARDHRAEKRKWRSKLEVIRRALRNVSGVTVKLTPRSHCGDPLPCLYVRPTGEGVPSAGEICRRLGRPDDRDPAIVVSAVGDEILVWPSLLQTGDERIIARRLKATLSPGA